MATASSFDHDFEVAKPDHYEVLLEDSGIREKHTACRNYGVFAFSYPEEAQAWLAVYVRNCTNVKFEDGFLYVEGQRDFEFPMATVLQVGDTQPQMFDVTTYPFDRNFLRSAPCLAAQFRPGPVLNILIRRILRLT